MNNFRYMCDYPWTCLHINADGTVRNCCFQMWPLGYLGERSVEEIWRGSALQRIRKMFREGKFPKICQNGSCPIYLKWVERGDCDYER